MKTKLGPLATLAGIWEGDQGIDVARTHSQVIESPYKERIVLEPMGPVNNGPQELWGLRYKTNAWRLSTGAPFHEELGYWMWDAAAGEVIRTFMVPRAVSVMAGGHVQADAKSFRLEAELGSASYGILSNKFLADSYETKRYTCDIDIHEDGSFTYFEDTQLWIPVNQEIFHHTDTNTLSKVEQF